ncbi:MAG: hypothetical protein AUK43_04795 [Oscillatoriales cyanobacterium CG2_30_40_61]|nr:MAG: hypothetical protein AUK43_04795 [Oscillatoriales cyanobacterium CG2_30_40_61]
MLIQWSILSSRGYNVRLSRDGNFAIKSAIEDPPDLILLDIMMPAPDGYEICSQLKSHEQTCQIPIIFISAKDQTLDKVKAFSVGGNDYITKPFELEELAIRVENQLKIWKLSQALTQQNSLLKAEKAIAVQQSTLFEQAKAEIIERKKAEVALQKAVKAADIANRAKSAFLANMSHELRTPLNAILGFAQLMNHDLSLKPDYQRYIEIINRAGSHLLELINDILEMSKIEAGRVTLNKTDFNLISFLNNLQNILQIQAVKKGLNLIVEYIYQEGENRELINSQKSPTLPTEDIKLHLGKMPPKWIKQLHEYACQCSDTGILVLLKEIPPENIVLTQALTHLVYNFEFDKILALLVIDK